MPTMFRRPTGWRPSSALESADVVLVTGDVEVFGPLATRFTSLTPPSWQPRLEWELLFTNAVGAGGQVMFPRLFRGEPILFDEGCRYAEDYRLWCRLSRMGRVNCPPQVIYRYRRHGSAISTRDLMDQTDCVCDIRSAYQAEYFGSDSRPGLTDGDRGLLAQDGRSFLTGKPEPCGRYPRYPSAPLSSATEGRFGVGARAALDAQIQTELTERFGYGCFARPGLPMQPRAAVCCDGCDAAPDGERFRQRDGAGCARGGKVDHTPRRAPEGWRRATTPGSRRHRSRQPVTPLVSILMPAYNAEQFIAEAIGRRWTRPGRA